MRRKLETIIVMLLGVLFAGGIALSDGVDAGSFVRDGAGARAFGLGGAFVAIADDASTAVWNPAGLAQLEGLSVGGMYTNKFGQDIYFQSFGGTAKIADFGVGLSMIRSSIEDIPYYGDGEGEYFSETQTLFLGSVGYDLATGRGSDLQTGSLSAILIGGNVKYYSHSLLEGKGSGVGFDLSVLLAFSWEWGEISVGFTSQDVGGTALKWIGTDHNPVNNVPWINKLGVSVGLLDQRLRLATGVDFAMERSHLNRLHLGVEYWAIDQLGARAGVVLGADGSRQLSAGGSIKWHDISFDYAYVPHPALGISHILSAQFSFPAWWESNEEQDVSNP